MKVTWRIFLCYFSNFPLPRCKEITALPLTYCAVVIKARPRPGIRYTEELCTFDFLLFYLCQPDVILKTGSGDVLYSRSWPWEEQRWPGWCGIHPRTVRLSSRCSLGLGLRVTQSCQKFYEYSMRILMYCHQGSNFYVVILSMLSSLQFKYIVLPMKWP